MDKVKQKFHGFSPSAKTVIVILIITVLWMVSGIFISKKEDMKKSEEVYANVKVINSEAALKSEYLSLNAITEANKVVQIKAETDGTVSEIIAKDGQFLKAGETIVKIDEESRREIIEQAEAELKRRKLNYESTKALFKKKLSSDIAVAETTAEYKTAKANLKRAKIDLEKTIIKAPFDGYVDRIHVSVGDFVSNFQQNDIAVFIDKDPMLAIAHIPERNIDMAKNIETAEIHYNSNSIKLGNIKFLSKVSDPATRTFRMEIEIDNSDMKLLSGETIQVKIPLREELAHRLPKSTLVLDIQGNLGVKTVNEDSIVKVHHVDIIEENGNSIWVTGLPKQISVIILGQSYVKDGEKVHVNNKAS